jgi:23S rRNA G2445 N2-methylase RlmL
MYGKRPSVDTREPDMRIAGFLDQRQFIIYLDTSGEALFKRGWRSRGKSGSACTTRSASTSPRSSRR